MTFPYSIMAYKGDRCSHTLGLVEADSEDAAFEQAVKLAAKMYPVADGWEGHDVIVIQPDYIIDDPETWIKNEPETRKTVIKK